MSDKPTPASTGGAPEVAPRIAGELIRKALLGTAEIPLGGPLTVDDRGARMEEAIVEGGLDLSAVKFDRPVAFERCTFEGPIVLRDAKFARVSVLNCRAPNIDARKVDITGDLDLNGTHLENPGGFAFNGEAMQIAGSVHFEAGFVAHGAVSLRLSNIVGGLICDGTFRNPFIERPKDQLYTPANLALNGHGVTVGASANFGRSFLAEGLVMFASATVGNVVVVGSAFTHGQSRTGPADASLSHDPSARFQLEARSGLSLLSVQIGGYIVFTDMARFEGLLQLRSAVVGSIADDGTLWQDPATGRPRNGVAIDLDGFRYSSFINSTEAHTDTSWRTRLAWLEAQPKEHLTDDFHAQPFTQCAEVLRNMGDSHGARMILFERERLRLKAKSVGFSERLAGHALGALAGYGYKNHYALYWALGIWLMGAAIFWTADALGQFRPADPHVLAEEHYQETLQPPTDYEPVNPFIYSADILLPIVELGQQAYWIPRNAGELTPDVAAAFPRLAKPAASALAWLFSGWLPKAYYYFEIAMGWVLVSIVIAGFSGLLGHAREE